MNKSARLTAYRAAHIITLAGEGAASSLAQLEKAPRIMNDAVILEKDGRILDVEDYALFRRRPATAFALHDLGPLCLAPALINAHCHLELSHLAGKTLRGRGFAPWLASLLPLVRAMPDRAESAAHISGALRVLRNCGIGHCADVGSRLPGLVSELASGEWSGAGEGEADPVSEDPQRVKTDPERTAIRTGSNPFYPLTHFLELIGFSAPPATAEAAKNVPMGIRSGDWHVPASASLPLPARAHCALSGHALYSTAPDALRAAHSWCRKNARVFSLHLAESLEEDECLRTGSGALRDLLAKFLPDPFPASGLSPVEYANRLGILDARTLAAHCVHLSDADLGILARSGSSVCLCPRSNAYINVGTARAREGATRGLLLCLGTDGLSSNTDLDMQKEMAAAMEIYGLSARAVLRMATLNGAAALGLTGLGSLERGRAAAFAVLGKDFARDLL
jgi:cytosine/adenosine deaminase-related metal-dependent hydrolase